LRVLNCDKQPDQPLPQQDDYDYRKEEEALVEVDVEHLIECLGVDRNTSYKIIERPDVKERQSAQPDYLIEDCTTGKLITIEYARFFESEESRKQKVYQFKKLNRILYPIHFPTPDELGERLSGFVFEKLNKGQFKNFSHTERILLARNRWGGLGLRHFVKAEPCLKLQKPLDCAHFYLIVEQKLLEVF